MYVCTFSENDVVYLDNIKVMNIRLAEKRHPKLLLVFVTILEMRVLSKVHDCMHCHYNRLFKSSDLVYIPFDNTLGTYLSLKEARTSYILLEAKDYTEKICFCRHRANKKPDGNFFLT